MCEDWLWWIAVDYLINLFQIGLLSLIFIKLNG